MYNYRTIVLTSLLWMQDQGTLQKTLQAAEAVPHGQPKVELKLTTVDRTGLPS